MSKRVQLFLGIMLFALNLAGALHAQSSEQTVANLPTTAAGAIELAVQNRTEIQMEKTQTAIRNAGVSMAKSAFLPTLDFMAEAYHTKQYDKFSGYTLTVDVAGQLYTANVEQSPAPYEIDSALELKYNLYAGGRDAAVLEEARANQTAAGHQMNITLRNVILDVSTAYWELRKAQVALGIAERWKDHSLASLRIAEAQLEAGRISGIEKELADLRFREREIAALRAERGLSRSLKKYRRALGWNDEDDGKAVRQIPQLTDDPDQEVSLPGVASQRHPEISKIEADILAAKARIKSARADFMPWIDIFAKYRNSGRDADTFGSAFDDMHRNDFVVGLQFRMNLFEGWRTRHRSRQAALEAELARLRLAQKEKELSLLVSERSMNVDNVKDDLTLAQQRLRVSEARERIARVQQQAGKYSELDYRKEQVAMQEDADKVLMARIDVMLARLNLALASLN